MASVFYQKRQVVGLSLEISLSKKKKIVDKDTYHDLSQTLQKWELCAVDMTFWDLSQHKDCYSRRC